MANDEKVSEKFPELFHYTNVSSFENIFKKQQFWATHYEDLNDSTEFVRFRLKVREFIRPKIRAIFGKRINWDAELAADINEQGSIDIVIDEKAEQLIDKVHRATFSKHMYKETFVISFCAFTQPYEAKNGLLSQWRGYGADGGVAIVLDTSHIEKLMQRDYDEFQLQLMYILSVIYDGKNALRRLKKEYPNVFEIFPEIRETLYPDKEQYDEEKFRSLLEEMHGHFVLGSTSVKHHAFHEENEVRIVVSPKTKDSYNSFDPKDPKLQKKIRYRQIGNCGEARYIELFGNDPLPIKRVIVGPSRIQNFNYQRIVDLVSKNPCIKVKKSGIPFLGQ